MKTFGTLRFGTMPAKKGKGANAWVVEAPPHVMMRLKRTFAVANKKEVGLVHLSDTPVNCRDLLWFLERYPMIVSTYDRVRLEALAQEHREREESIEEILAGTYEPRAFDLAIPLRTYQRTAADLLLRSRGLLLGDDVGIGKTASAIATFSDPRTLPAVVVTLAHLPRQWVKEIARFAPNLRVRFAKTGKPEDLTKKVRGKPPEEWDVMVINYHKLSTLAPVLARVAKSVVFDEVQELRRDGSAKYNGAKHLADAADFRLGLSATPIFNYGGEIWPIINCLSPGALGSREEFSREWCVGYESRPKLQDPAAFGCYLRDAGLMLRRTRSDVGRELPPLTTVSHEIDADLAILDKVEDRAAELARIILTQAGMEKGAKLRASEELSWRLRQATGIAKARPVADFVRMLVEQGEKVLLFGWHREVYELWKDRLVDLRPAFYTGEESPVAKAESARRFTSGETKILVMSLRAGAGVDGLQHACRTVVFGEIDWSPGVHEQCIGRVFRDGQPDPVLAYYLIADSGSDPVVADVLGLKRQQAEGLRDPNAPAFERLEVDPDHIKKLAADYLRRRGLSVSPAGETLPLLKGA